MVCAAAYDFTVKGGSIGYTGEEKVTRLRQMALRGRWPIVWFIDSGGARIDPGSSHPDMISLFAGSGHLFREQVHMSGVVPQVAAMVGPGAAGTAYIPGLADFVPMVKGIGSLALGGPALVKAVTGAGHRRAGARRLEGALDEERRRRRRGRERRRLHRRSCKKYLSFFPSSCDELPPRLPVHRSRSIAARSRSSICSPRTRASRTTCTSSSARSSITASISTSSRAGRARSSPASRASAASSVGIVANQPNHLGGILDVDSADKAARFIQICDAFNVPLVFLQDVPGFMVGSKVEHAGIIRHGAKMLHVMSAATVPKITRRRAQGLRRRLLRDVRPRLRAGSHRRLADGRDQRDGRRGHGRHRRARSSSATRAPPPEVKQAIVEQIQKNIDIYKVAGWGLIDDVIDPRDTRRAIAWGLELARHKQRRAARKKRGVIPV